MLNSLKTSQIKTLQIGRQIGRGILFFSLALGLSGCAEFLSGKPKEESYLEVDGASLGCLDDISQDLSKFLNAEAGGEVLDKTMACIDNTLTEFQKKVEGRQNADAFTADEIYDIFSTFVAEARLSRTAAANLIQLKAALIGGSSERITKAEISELKKFLYVVKDEAKKLTPYVKVFKFEETQKLYTREFINEAFSSLNNALKNLLRASKIANSSYSFNDFKNFVVNVLNLADDGKNMVEILAKINYVINGYQTELTDAERDEYINNITHFMRLASLYQNRYFSFNITKIDEIDASVDFVLEGISLLEGSLQYKKTNLISANSIDRLLIEIAASDILPHKVRASSLINFYKALFVRLFEAGLQGQVQYFTGLKPVNLINLKRELGIYQTYARLIAKTFPAGVAETHLLMPELQSRMSVLSPAAETDILNRFDANNQYLITQAVTELKNQFLNADPATLFYNERFVVALNQNDWKQSRQDLIQIMQLNVLSRLMMIAYAKPYQVLGATNLQLDNFGMYTWYADFKALFTDIKYFDPRTFNAGVTSVTVTNLFSRLGNGDELLTYRELNQYFGTLIAGAGGVGKELYRELLERRCDLAELDVFGKHWTRENCLDQILKEKYKHYFASLPHLTQYLDTLSATDFQKYFRDLINIMRYNTADEGFRVESSDLTGLATMAYFIEGTYLVHDTNRNAMLSEAEIRAAYPKFKKVARDFAYSSSAAQIEEFNSWKSTLAGLGCFSEEDLIRESFIFLVYNGRTPSSSDLNIGACFLGKPLITFKGEVSRLRLTQAFKSLKSILAP